ncbi:MAG: hypothetical protein HKN27_10390 [Silicimonas sp.]|nr:hypothetical protein [Silicimonas sp.]
MPFTVYFHDMVFDEDSDYETKPESYTYEKLVLGDADGRAEIFEEPSSGVLAAFRGQGVPSYLKLRPEEKETLKVFLPAMKNAGARRCLLSYDGGNDEGFGQLDSCHDANGNEIDQETLATDEGLLRTIAPMLAEQQKKAKESPFYNAANALTPQEWAKGMLKYEVPVLTLSILLGSGYGTGEYQLYGRATLDLDAMTITDDPKAPYPHGSSL